MESVNLINFNNENIKATVIRYFELNGNRYFIYSLNEIDEQNYVKLYAVKINVENDVLTSNNITDENEWNVIKEEIKNIVRGNKNGIAEVTDLNFNELNSLKIMEHRVFKLSNQLVLLLGANKKVVEEVVEQAFDLNPTIETEVSVEPSVPDFNVEHETQNAQSITAFDINPKPVTATVENDENHFQELYEAEKEKNNKLLLENEQLRNQLEKIKNILNK